MLTAGGVLPPRDEELARTGQWLDSVLGTVEPPAAKRLVRAYATWQVMRWLRASAGRAARPRTYTAHARRNIRAAASFLTWLHGRGAQPGTVPVGLAPATAVKWMRQAGGDWSRYAAELARTRDHRP